MNSRLQCLLFALSLSACDTPKKDTAVADGTQRRSINAEVISQSAELQHRTIAIDPPHETPDLAYLSGSITSRLDGCKGGFETVVVNNYNKPVNILVCRWTNNNNVEHRTFYGRTLQPGQEFRSGCHPQDKRTDVLHWAMPHAGNDIYFPTNPQIASQNLVLYKHKNQGILRNQSKVAKINARVKFNQGADDAGILDYGDMLVWPPNARLIQASFANAPYAGVRC